MVHSDFHRKADAAQLTGGLKVKVGEDRLPVRRESTALEIFPHEVRHVADALVKAAAWFADQATGE